MLDKLQTFCIRQNSINATKQKEVKSKENVASVNGNSNVLNNNLNTLASLGSSQVVIKFGINLERKMEQAYNDYKVARYNEAVANYLSVIKKLDYSSSNITVSEKSYYTIRLFQAYYMLGKSYNAQGNYAKAREAFEKAEENLKENISLNPAQGSEDQIDQSTKRAQIFLLQAYNEIAEIKKVAKEKNINANALDRIYGCCYDSDYLGMDEDFARIRDALDE